MMRYTFTIACTLLGVALSLFNLSGYDPHNLILFLFSVPMWLVELFTDMHSVNVFFMYFLTIVSWGIFGYLVDLGVARIRTWKHL
jgi:hypothetical protein